MEKNLESNKGLKVWLIIFVALTVILGGFIFYDKVLKEEKKDVPVKEKEETKQKENVVDNNDNSVIVLASKYQNIKDKTSYIAFDKEKGTFKFYRNECHGYNYMNGTYSIKDNEVILLVKQTYIDL